MDNVFVIAFAHEVHSIWDPKVKNALIRALFCFRVKMSNKIVHAMYFLISIASIHFSFIYGYNKTEKMNTLFSRVW